MGQFITNFIELFYPAACPLCNSFVGQSSAVCASCWQSISFYDNAQCKKCGISILTGPVFNHKLCEICHQQPPLWHHGYAVGKYEGGLKHAILAYKHSDKTHLAKSMAQWLARKLQTQDIDLIIPIPISRNRLLKRKYNQAGLLATALANILDVPVAPNLLIKNNAIGSTKDKTKEERVSLLNGQISLRDHAQTKICDNKILLIDDVMTTGATLSAATKALISAGANYVDVAVIARVEYEIQN